MANEPTLSMEPGTPTAGDAIVFKASGEVPEGSTIKITADGDELQRSPAFGIGLIPEGTGNEARSVEITGGTSGTFFLTVTDPIDPDTTYVTDPVYYYNDAPTYAYPDTANVRAALDAAIDQSDVGVDVSREGALLTVNFGGRWSGKDVPLDVDVSDIGGSPTGVTADTLNAGGPYTFGPIVLEANDYVADLVDDTDTTLLFTPLDFTVGA